MKTYILKYLIIFFSLYITVCAGCLSFSYAETEKIIKFATIAPDGSTWTNVINDIDKEIRTRSNGKMKLKIYAGGTMGDEMSALRKMRVSQIHCAAFTSLGLANILPATRILDLPFLYRDAKEISFIKDELYDNFYEAFEKKGYILLGWSELGFVCFFSKKEIKTISGLRSTSMWLWEGDPLAKTLLNFLDISPIPLPLMNVTRSIQKGVIDTIYGSPLAVIALGWYKDIKYMLDVQLVNATGALLMTKKYYDNLSPDLQVILKDSFRNNMVRLSHLIQKDNTESKEVLVANGIKLIPGDNTIIKELEDASIKTSEMLAGRLYSTELLKVIKTKLEKFRKGNHIQDNEESIILETTDITN